MKSQASIEIDKSIGEVFRFTNEHVAEWSLVVVADRPSNNGVTGVGSKSTIVTEDHGKRMEFDSTVTEYDPPHRIAIRMIGKMFDIDATYEFEDRGNNRTRVTQFSDVHGKGLMWLFFFLFGGLMKKSSCEAGMKEMQSLKRFCEQERP